MIFSCNCFYVGKSGSAAKAPSPTVTSTYKDCEKEVRELKRKQENLNQYLGRTQPDPAQEQQEKKDTPNL